MSLESVLESSLLQLLKWPRYLEDELCQMADAMRRRLGADAMRSRLGVHTPSCRD